MTNDLPDALIAVIWDVFDEYIDSYDDRKEGMRRISEAFDFSGLAEDLKFYGDANNHVRWMDDISLVDKDKGQRARTRLSSLGITNNGGNNEK